MTDSSKQIGECRHGRYRNLCEVCCREDENALLKSQLAQVCRDLNELRENARNMQERLAGEIERLKAENATLRADKGRLDWIEANVSDSHFALDCTAAGQSCREAIDAARKETT